MYCIVGGDNSSEADISAYLLALLQGQKVVQVAATAGVLEGHAFALKS